LNNLIPLAETIAARLKARRESIAIAESSTGGLILVENGGQLSLPCLGLLRVTTPEF
jgi:hypothetical protein